MISSLRRIGPLVLAAAIATTGFAQTQFTRLQKKPGTKVESVQTRAVRYVPTTGDGPIIWLIGVAHIGEADYYKGIQKLLDQQGLVLFEGVSNNGERKDVDLSSTYKLFASTIGLVFQLTSIDYKHDNWKNSDVTWQELQDLAAKEGGQQGKDSLDAIGNAMDTNSGQGKMIASFLDSIKNDPGSQAALRVVLAEALSSPDMLKNVLSALQSDVVLRARNDKIFSDLQGNLKTNSAPRSVALFYGAAHMPDLESRITKTLGYKMTEDRWYSAITADESKVTGQGAMLLTMFRQMMVPKVHGPSPPPLKTGGGSQRH